MEGHKNDLGMHVGQNKSVKFWLSVLGGLKNRNVKDILITCIDGLTGFSQAIDAILPDSEIQPIHHSSNLKHNKICFLQGTQTADG